MENSLLSGLKALIEEQDKTFVPGFYLRQIITDKLIIKKEYPPDSVYTLSFQWAKYKDFEKEKDGVKPLIRLSLHHKVGQTENICYCDFEESEFEELYNGLNDFIQKSYELSHNGEVSYSYKSKLRIIVKVTNDEPLVWLYLDKCGASMNLGDKNSLGILVDRLYHQYLVRESPAFKNYFGPG